MLDGRYISSVAYIHASFKARFNSRKVFTVPLMEFLYSIPLTAYRLYLRFVLSYNLFQSYFVYCKLYIHFMNIGTQVFNYIANVTLIFIKISFIAKRVLDTFVIYICFS